MVGDEQIYFNLNFPLVVFLWQNSGLTF